MSAKNTDGATLERWISRRDPEAFRQLVERHSGMVYATCKRVLGNDADAEDVVQECFEVLARGQQSSRVHRVGPWLYGMAVHRSLQRVRSETRRKQREAHFASESPAYALTEWEDIYEYIDEAIFELTEDLRVAVVSHFIEGKSHAAIARDIGISRRAVGYRIKKGVESIAKSLSKRGVTVAAPALVAVLGANLSNAAAIPATLSASLGKLTLACTADQVAVGTALTVSAKLIGGILLMKKSVVCVAVAAAIGLWMITQPNEVEQAGTSGTEKSIRITEEASLGTEDETVSAGLPESVSEITPEPEAVAPIEGRVLSGRVEDSDGAPVGGAEVEIGGGLGTILLNDSVQSAEDGSFEFTGLASTKQIWLTARKEGFAGNHRGPLDLTYADMTGVVVTMFAEGTISGRVVDSSGVPWSNVLIFAELDPSSQEFKSHSRLTRASTHSDTNGEFRLSGMAPGTYRFVANYQPASFWGQEDRAVLALEADEHFHDVTLTIAEYELTISGYIYDTAGRPVQEAEVEYIAGRITRGVRSDETGYYETIPLAEGRNQLSVSHPAYRSASLQPVFPGSTNVDFVLEAYSMVSGRAVDSQTGNAIPIFEIAAAEGHIEEITTFTFRETEKTRNDEGLFLIEKVVSGDVTLAVRASGYAMAMQPVFVPPGKSVEGILIRLQPAVGIKGVVTDVSGNAIADARIFYGAVPHESWHAEHAAAVTGADGAFVLDSIPATGQLLSAYHRDYSVGSTRVRQGSEDPRPVAIVLEQGGVVKGLITMDGEPFANGEVSVRYSEYFYSPHHYGKTNQDGQYSLSGLTPGDVWVSLSTRYGEDRSGWRRLDRAAILEDGETTVVDFDASRYYGILEGTVSVGGEGIMGAIVIANAEANGLVEMNRSITRQDGHYRLEQLPPGPVTLEVIATLGDGRQIEDAVTVRMSEDEVIRQDIDLQY